MAGERTYPVLTCPDLGAAVDFYTALGFETAYRQQRPNPYAVVRLEDIDVHLVEVAGLLPEDSNGSAIVVVPDAEDLYSSFVANLRSAHGRLPAGPVPRLLRPRRKAGTTTGFTVVDPGGNWLRFYRAGEAEDAPPSGAGLARVLEVAARQGDAKGDLERALAVLEAGLVRHADAPPLDVVRVHLYRAELLVRAGRVDEAEVALAQATQVELDESEHEEVDAEIADLREHLP